MISSIRACLAVLSLALSSSAYAVETSSLEKEFCKSETALGNLITDAMRISSGADIALLACNVPQKVIDVSAQSKFSATDSELLFGKDPLHFHVVQLSGEKLLAELENELSLLPAASEKFHQVSGIRMVVNLAMKPGNRIVKITIGGNALDLGKTYTVAIPSSAESQVGTLQNVVNAEIAKSGMLRARTYGRIKFVE